MRPYQLAAVAACLKPLASPSGRAIIAMPPGTGAMHTADAILAPEVQSKPCGSG